MNRLSQGSVFPFGRVAAQGSGEWIKDSDSSLLAKMNNTEASPAPIWVYLKERSPERLGGEMRNKSHSDLARLNAASQSDLRKG